MEGGYAPTCYCYYSPNIPEKYFEQAEISAPPGRVFVRFTPRIISPFHELDEQGVPASPLLITPVRQKKYGMYASTIENTWEQAEDQFKVARRIVIVGYSFPPTDVRPMKLLRSTLNARPGEIELEIVALGVSDIVSRIGEKALIKARQLTAHDMKFEEYLAAQYRRVPDLMVQAADADSEVRDWMLRLYAMNQVSPEERVRLHAAANQD
jgi:hypothetical protein